MTLLGELPSTRGARGMFEISDAYTNVSCLGMLVTLVIREVSSQGTQGITDTMMEGLAKVTICTFFFMLNFITCIFLLH